MIEKHDSGEEFPTNIKKDHIVIGRGRNDYNTVLIVGGNDGRDGGMQFETTGRWKQLCGCLSVLPFPKNFHPYRWAWGACGGLTLGVVMGNNLLCYDKIMGKPHLK